MKRFYLSGPMTGIAEKNYPAFAVAASELRALGHEVVNPAELCGGCVDWHVCIRTDIKALCDCTHIVLLPGWEHSNGAHLELHLAHRMGLDVVALDRLVFERQTEAGERGYKCLKR